MYKILGIDQKEYGPVSADQLRQWIAQGRANAQTKAQAEGGADWKPLADFAEFADVLQGPLRAMPTPIAPPPGAVGATAKTSGLAIASLVLAVLGPFSCGVTALVALVLGIIALVNINKSQGAVKGSGLAIAAIVISALMLLLAPAMLLPALSKAKARAESIQCLNNVKQLGLGVMMYASDNKDEFPPAAKWCDILQPYLGGANPFLCKRGDPAQRSHYAYNKRLAGIETSKLSAPAQTVLVFEADGGWNASGGPELLLQKSRHANAVTVVFADGHAESVPLTRLARLRWDP